MDDLGLVPAPSHGIPPDDITLDFVARLDPAVGRAILDTESLLLDPASGETHLLDAPGTVIIASLDGRSTLAEIADDIAEIVGADAEIVRNDVLDLVTTLGASGLIEGVERDQHRGHDHGGQRQEGVPVGTDLAAWEGWGDLDLPAGPVLVINWGTNCGFCTRIAEDLAELRASLEAKGFGLRLVTLGSQDAFREQVAGVDLPMSRVDTTPPFFEGLGTPVAYAVDADRTVLEPLAVGADQVPDLVRRLAE